MFLLRAARSSDLEAIRALAEYLDSPNLPADLDFLRERLARSDRSFAHPGPPSVEREYQFVLTDPEDRVVGTCAILSKHGTSGMPHVFLRVCEESRSASSINVSVQHRTLQLGATEDGPTEIGALVLAPRMRGQSGWPGKLLSWGRFVYIGLHRDRFEPHLLAEMRASLTPDGRNRFWEAFGHHFTGLTYAEADRKSGTDKSFILDLFPDTPFYATLLDDEVSAELGRVHPEARPALKLLERAGFGFIGEIDPFDAGPFYGAPTRDVTPIRDLVHATLSHAEPASDAEPAIVATEEGGEFRAVAVRATLCEGALQVGSAARDRLRLSPGSSVVCAKLPPSSAVAPTRPEE